MTNKEKMLAGKCYCCDDPEGVLTAERLHARRLTHRYNMTPPDAAGERLEILHSLFGSCGKNLLIEPSFRCDYGYNITLGDNVYMNFDCVILDCASVTVGNNVFFAPNVQVYTAGHALDAEQRAAGYEYALPITIGNDVWLGGSCVLLPGVTIGDGSVIGAGSVINRDIPPGVVVAGNPSRVVREITEADRQRFTDRFIAD